MDWLARNNDYYGELEEQHFVLDTAIRNLNIVESFVEVEHISAEQAYEIMTWVRILQSANMTMRRDAATKKVGEA